MPTHREHPWERDLAARRRRTPAPYRDHPLERDLAVALGRPKAQPTWRVPIAIAVIGAIGLALILTQGPELAKSPAGATARVAPAGGGAVTKLRTRFVNRATLQVWGRTTAPDRAAIRIRLRAGKAASLRRVARAESGRFSTTVRLPRALRGRTLRVSAVTAG